MRVNHWLLLAAVAVAATDLAIADDRALLELEENLLAFSPLQSSRRLLSTDLFEEHAARYLTTAADPTKEVVALFNLYKKLYSEQVAAYGSTETTQLEYFEKNVFPRIQDKADQLLATSSAGTSGRDDDTIDSTAQTEGGEGESDSTAQTEGGEGESDSTAQTEVGEGESDSTKSGTSQTSSGTAGGARTPGGTSSLGGTSAGGSSPSGTGTSGGTTSGGTTSGGTNSGNELTPGGTTSSGTPISGGTASGGATSDETSLSGGKLTPSGNPAGGTALGGVTPTSGGTTSGGTSTPGGTPISGGTTSGGTSAAGGTTSGGTSAAGGTTSGRTSSTGGTTSGGTSATGGTTSGGTSSTGGTTSGGTSTTGGTTSGGTSTTGGTTSGGTPATGTSASGGTTSGGTGASDGTTGGETSSTGKTFASETSTSKTLPSSGTPAVDGTSSSGFAAATVSASINLASGTSFWSTTYNPTLSSTVNSLGSQTRTIETVVQSSSAGGSGRSLRYAYTSPTIIQPYDRPSRRFLSTESSPVDVLFCDVEGNAIWKWSATEIPDATVTNSSNAMAEINVAVDGVCSATSTLAVSAYQTGCSLQNHPEGCNNVYYRGCSGITISPTSERIVIARTGGRTLGVLNYKSVDNTCQGQVVDAISTYRGKKFNSPTFAEYANSGILYFTDSPFGLATSSADFDGDTLDKSPLREIPFNGVYLLRNGTGQSVELVDCEMTRPNKIAFSPAHDIMYITNSQKHNSYVKSFVLAPDGTVSKSSVFFNFTAHPELETDQGFANGVKVDDNGFVYVVCYKGVYIFSPKGELAGAIMSSEELDSVTIGLGRLFISGSFGLVAQTSGVPSQSLPRAQVTCSA